MATNPWIAPYTQTLTQGAQVAQALVQAALQKRALDQAQQQFAQRQDLAEKEFGMQQQLEKAAFIGQGAKTVDPNGNVNVTAPEPASTQSPAPVTTDVNGLPAQGLSIHPALNTASGVTANVPANPNTPTVSIGGATLQPATPWDKTQMQIESQKALEAGTMPTAGQVYGDLLIPGSDPNLRIPLNEIGPAYNSRMYAQMLRNSMQGQQQPGGSVKDYTDTRTGHVTRITFDGAGNEVKRVDLGKIAGEKNPEEGPRPPNAWEQWQIDQAKKQQANQEEYNSVLNDTLARAGGDPAKAMKLVSTDAAASQDNPARRQLSSVLKQLNALKGKPDEVQSILGQLNGGETGNPNGSAAPTPARPANSFDLLHPSTWFGKGTPAQTPTAPAASAPAKPQTQEGAPAKPATGTASIPVGATAINRKTNQRVQWNGKAWVPIQQ